MNRFSKFPKWVVLTAMIATPHHRATAQQETRSALPTRIGEPQREAPLSDRQDKRPPSQAIRPLELTHQASRSTSKGSVKINEPTAKPFTVAAAGVATDPLPALPAASATDHVLASLVPSPPSLLLSNATESRAEAIEPQSDLIVSSAVASPKSKAPSTLATTVSMARPRFEWPQEIGSNQEIPATVKRTPNLSTVTGKRTDGSDYQMVQNARAQLRNHAVLTARQMGWDLLQSLAQRRADSLLNNAAVVALADAKCAIREAGDFLGRYGPVDQAAMQRLIEAHQTEVLKGTDIPSITSNMAADAYFDHARKRLMEATGGGPLAADALAIIADSHLQIENSSAIDRAAAITCLRAAIGGHPGASELANQLGYELMVDGRLAESERVLKHSLAIQSNRSAWQNLAENFRLRGEIESARACIAQAMAAPAQQPPGMELLQLSPQQFAAVSPAPISFPATPQASSSQPPALQQPVGARGASPVVTSANPVQAQTVPEEPATIIGKVASFFSERR